MAKDPHALGLTHTLPGRARARAASTRDPDELPPGTRVGSYVLEEARFRGGFAVVYLARHHDTGHKAAVKVLRPELQASPQMFERFRREAETIQRIGHPNIVTLLELGEDPRRPYLAMEWLEGHNLEDTLAERGPFSVSETVALLVEIATALHAAHTLGVVHRDVKAQNVVVVPKDGWYAVKLLDFGIAKLLEPPAGAGGLTSSSVILGTPLTMAPEQILGQPVDARTDLYALGLLAFQLVTGRLPFTGPSSVEVEEMHLTAPPPPASDLAPVPAAFDAVIRRCLAKNRDERYPDALALVAALRAIASSPPEGKTATVVLCAEACFDPDEPDVGDDLFDDAEEALALFRAETLAQGFSSALESCNAVLTHRVLPRDPGLARRARRDAIDTALTLRERLDEKLTHHGVHVALTLHVTSVVDGGKDAQSPLTEAIPSGSYSAKRRSSVTATSPVLEELTEDFEVEPVTGTTLTRVTRRQSSDR